MQWFRCQKLVLGLLIRCRLWAARSNGAYNDKILVKNRGYNPKKSSNNNGCARYLRSLEPQDGRVLLTNCSKIVGCWV